MITESAPARLVAIRLIAGLGVVLLVASAVCELSDLAPEVELWLGAAGAVALLVATVVVRGPAAVVLRQRAGLLAGTGIGAVLAVVGLWQDNDSPTPTILLLLVPVGLLFVTAFLAVAQARAVAGEAAVQQRRAELAAEEGERLRWVRELHDETLQDLAAVEVTLGSLEPGADPDRVTNTVADARALVQSQIRSLRALLVQMRPLALELHGLGSALEHLATQYDERTSAHVTAALDELPRLDAEDELALYRIVQEAVGNAVAHASAQSVVIRAEHRDGLIRVSVTDDGQGFSPQEATAAGRGYGMVSMRERAEALGSQLEVSSAAGRGTRVEVKVSAPVARPG